MKEKINEIKFKPGNMGYKITKIHFELLNNTYDIYNKNLDVMRYLCIKRADNIKEKIDNYFIYELIY